MQYLIVIAALLWNLLTGGSVAGNWQPLYGGSYTTPSTSTSSWSLMWNGGLGGQSSLLSLIYMMGGNINMSQSSWDSIDQTINIDDGWERYGFGQGSSVRIHGNWSDGVYFDFTVKANSYDQSREWSEPIDGLTISSSSYSSSDSSYSFSVGPLNLRTALNLFSYATANIAELAE